MTCRIESNAIPKEHLKYLSIEDFTLMLKDQIVFGCFAYEVITDDDDQIVSVKYSPVYRIMA